MTSERMRKTTKGAPSLERKDRFKSWSAMTEPSSLGQQPLVRRGCRGHRRSTWITLGTGTGVVGLDFQADLLDSGSASFVQHEDYGFVSRVFVRANENPLIVIGFIGFL